MELREVDAKFSRLHGGPAGRALDLYGRVTGPPVAPSPEAARTLRPHGARGKAGAANIKYVFQLIGLHILYFRHAAFARGL